MIFTELQKRILTALVLLPIIFIIIFFSRFFFTLFIISIMLLSFHEWFKLNKKNFSIITLLGFLVILVSVFSAYFLRGATFENTVFFIFILLICICSDIGGYCFGKIIGGRKLIKTCPNKTVSGSIGSFIFSLFPIFLLNLQIYTDLYFELSTKNIFFCLIISLSCQIGDLIISYFKRLRNVKDTGNILPGHGGLLDRIDGIIFAIPVVYILKITQIF